MITEDYVSFETAKLLKEKGFPQCKKEDGFRGLKYNIDGELTFAPYAEHYRVVTQSLTLKWLREVHNIHISVQPDYPNYKLSWCWSVDMLHNDCFVCKKHQNYIDTYEQAVEAAIKYCLENLI